MGRRGNYKYVCLGCGEATYFSRQERIRAAGMRCSYCGCRQMEPSKASVANHNIPVFHDIKRGYDEQVKAKMAGELSRA